MSLNSDGTIPLRVALPLLLEKELPCVWDAQVGVVDIDGFHC